MPPALADWSPRTKGFGRILTKMKILVFYPYIPYPLNRGTYQRTFHLLRELAKSHEVDLFALAEKSEGTEHKTVFEAFCKRVEFFPFKHPTWQKLFPQR